MNETTYTSFAEANKVAKSIPSASVRRRGEQFVVVTPDHGPQPPGQQKPAQTNNLDEIRKEFTEKLQKMEGDVKKFREQANSFRNMALTTSKQLSDLEWRLEEEKKRTASLKLALETAHSDRLDLGHLKLIRAFFEEKYGAVKVVQSSKLVTSGLACNICGGTGGLLNSCRSCDNGYLKEIAVMDEVQFTKPTVLDENRNNTEQQMNQQQKR